MRWSLLTLRIYLLTLVGLLGYKFFTARRSLSAGEAIMTFDAKRSRRAIYLLSDLIGGKARLHGKTIGKLTDIVVAEQGKLPEVTHLLIDRPFGHKSLMVPWSKVDQLSANGGTIRNDRVSGTP